MSTPEQKPLINITEYKPLDVNKEWGKFTQSIDKHFSPKDVDEIRRAFFLAGGAHSGEFRETGDSYFTHAIDAAKTLVDEFEIYETNMVVAALLHDVGENSKALGDLSGMSVKEAQDALFKEVRNYGFGKRVARMVVALTHFEGMSLEEYHNQLEHAGAKVLVIKLADRLHNTRTQWSSSKEKQVRKSKETEEVYIPMFEKARKQYPEVIEHGIKELYTYLKFISSID